jgi:AmmeMemoRadiSam system protein A
MTGEKSSDYSAAEKALLLKLARDAMERVIGRQAPPNLSSLPEKFREVRSCFVTLHTPDGNLRGCIGSIEPHEPLADNVLHNALNAAFRDPRFNPVASKAELESLTLEISVLTPPEDIAGIEDFILGEHGIILSCRRRSSVFLPQVAPEQGWDVKTTMEHLSMKAGLHPDAWREADARFSVFRAIVFSEGEEG